MELVKLLKGGDKTCYKHSYLRTVGKTFHIFFFFYIYNSSSGEGMGKDIQCDWCFGVALDEGFRLAQN